MNNTYNNLNKRLVHISDQFYFYLKYCDLNTGQKVFKFRSFELQTTKRTNCLPGQDLNRGSLELKASVLPKSKADPNMNGSGNQMPGIQVVTVPKFKCIAELTFYSSAVLDLRLGTHHRMDTHTFLQVEKTSKVNHYVFIL